jgi:hypothetical protein
MATYYWRGGAGTWDATTTTNWSTTSGGSGGAGPPTSADNVIFDTLSNATAYAVTIGTNAVCLDVTIAGPAAGNVTITSSATSVINVFGSWTNAATGVAFTTSNGAAITFSATTTGKTITTNNVALGIMALNINGVGGGWTFGSNYTSTGGIFSIAGSYDTANFSFTVSSLTFQGTLVRSVSLGSSTITCTAATGINASNTANLTFNAGTSTISLSSANPTINGGGLTFNIVNLTSTATNGTSTIQGANTFATLNQSSPAATLRTVVFSANQTITGTLTLGAANTAVLRVLVRSDVIGTQRTLTVATIATLADVDFQDIVAAGASGTWSGTRLGNCTNNSNITFVAGKTVYWNLAGAQNWNATGWALTSGGAPAVNNFPLAQDTVEFDDIGSVTGVITINANWNIGTLNITKTGAMTLASGTQTPRIFGSVTLQSATVTTGTGAYSYSAYGVSSTFTSNGATFTPPLTINAPTGTLTLGNAFIQPSTVTTTLTAGTLNLSSYTLTIGLFNSSATTTRTLAFGTGNITLTGVNATIFNTTTVTNMTITGTAVVNCVGTTGTSVQTRTFIVGSHGEAQAISVNINPGTSAVDIFRLATTSGAFKDVTFSSTFTGTIQIANSIIVYGNFDVGGTTTYLLSSSIALLTFGATSGTQNINFRSSSYGTAAVSSSMIFGSASSTATTYVLTNGFTALSTATIPITLTAGTLNLNNQTLTAFSFALDTSNVTALAFGTATINLTGTGTIWVGSTNCTVTGTPQVICTDNSATARSINPALVSEANAISFRITAGTGTFAMQNANTSVLNLDFTDGVNPTGFGGSFTAQFHNVYGNFKASTNMTSSSGNGTLSFIATSGTKTVTTAGVTFDRPFSFNGVGGTWQLQDALTLGSTRTLVLNNGTLNLNNYTATAGLFNGSGTTARTLAFGTSNITLTGLNTTVWTTPTAINFSYTGTPTVNVTGAGILGETRTISHGSSSGGTEANAPSFNISAGADSIVTTGNSVIKNLNFTGFTGTLIANGRFIYGNLILVSGMTLDAAGVSTTTFAGTSGTQQITTAGQTINFPITFNGLGGTFAFQDALTLDSLRTLTFTNGTLQLKAGVTSTVGSFVTSGTTQKFLQSTLSGTQATISQASGTVDVTYLTIKDSNATGGATFNAYVSNFNVDSGNNTGWNGLSISDFAIGDVGSVTYSLTINLTGVAGIGAVGTVGLGARTFGLTGNAATGNVGTPVAVYWKPINTEQTPSWTQINTQN